VQLRPCPPWCTLSQHFAPDGAVDADDGFHHYGPEIAVPTSHRRYLDGPESIVKVLLKAWTNRMDAAPGPGIIELQFADTESDTDLFVELTPDQARAVSSALLKITEIIDNTGTAPGEAHSA
jgi:hypothetical protein